LRYIILKHELAVQYNFSTHSLLALYPSPHSHSLSSPTRPLSSLPVLPLFSTRPPSSPPVAPPLLYPSPPPLLYLSLPFLLPVLSLLLPDLSLSISFTVPWPEIAKMGQVEGERRLVMCESLWILPFLNSDLPHISRYIPTHVKGGGKIVQLGRAELTR